jgi:hypothetical protein
MERAHERGYARSIGVSNFSVSELDGVMGILSFEILDPIPVTPHGDALERRPKAL